MKLKLRLVQYLLMSLVGLATLASEVSVAQTNGNDPHCQYDSNRSNAQY